jgi:putative glycosyltransferase (TIGR04348 family)
MVRIVIVTPALAEANNGNWQTARRWSLFLRQAYRVSVVGRWTGSAGPGEDLMIALHARRSASSIAAWRAAHPDRPLVVVLTGTDLYQDIDTDAGAQRSLALADRLVVLNELGARRLPAPLRDKVRVILQSAPPRRPLAKPLRHLRVLMVGHLRAVKDPAAYCDAARRLAAREDIFLDHVGAALDDELKAEAELTMRTNPRYRWLGPLPHGQARARIQAAHALVHPSRLEGGAHVVIEALSSGTPVLASRIDGNLGLLGPDYAGCFEPGDAAGLAALIERARDDPTMLPALAAQCAARAPLFAPERERASLIALIEQLPVETPR